MITNPLQQLVQSATHKVTLSTIKMPKN